MERVEAGEVVTIARAGKPIADLVPHSRVDIVWGTLRGRIEIAADFDAPDQELVELFEA